MTLSDEDYGIILNDLQNKEIEWDAATIMSSWIDVQEWNKFINKVKEKDFEYLADVAAFIILSEGRELP